MINYTDCILICSYLLNVVKIDLSQGLASFLMFKNGLNGVIKAFKHYLYVDKSKKYKANFQQDVVIIDNVY